MPKGTHISHGLTSRVRRRHRWAGQHLTLVRIMKKAGIDYYEFLGRKRRERIWAKVSQDIRQRG